MIVPSTYESQNHDFRVIYISSLVFLVKGHFRLLAHLTKGLLIGETFARVFWLSLRGDNYRSTSISEVAFVCIALCRA
jgi:hypothetical protein